MPPECKEAPDGFHVWSQTMGRCVHCRKPMAKGPRPSPYRSFLEIERDQDPLTLEPSEDDYYES